jgi:hypothetical protein
MRSRLFACIAALILFLPLIPALQAQQVVQRGALGTAASVYDETEEWTTPILLVSDSSVLIYMPDISNPDWLARNYSDYINRGVYTLSLFTFYKTPEACRANQLAWGLGDTGHLNACDSIGYRVRRALIDPHSKSVTLITAAMVDQNGNIDPSSVEDRSTFRTWDQLDANTQKALAKADGFIKTQMKIYDNRQHNIH